MRLRFLVAPGALALVASLTASAPCAAGDATRDAEIRFREGIEAVKRWDFEGARIAMLQAYALDPKPKYLWNLAISEVKSGRPAEGLGHFRLYFVRPEATADERQRVQALMKDAEGKTGHITVTVPSGTLVSVDGVRSAAPDVHVPIDVLPGRHAIEASLGGRSASQAAEVRAGETIDLHLDLGPESAPPVEAPAAPPSSPPAATAPAATAPSPTAPSAEPPTSAPEAPRASAARWLVPGGIVAAGVAGLVAGGAFLVKAGSDRTKEDQARSEAPPVCPLPPAGPCAALNDAANTVATDRNVATGFFVGGGALVVGGILTWALWPKPSAHDAAASGFVAPMWIAGGGGAQWVGGF